MTAVKLLLASTDHADTPDSPNPPHDGHEAHLVLNPDAHTLFRLDRQLIELVAERGLEGRTLLRILISVNEAEPFTSTPCY